MKIHRQGVGETIRTCALLGLAACGGPEFTGSTSAPELVDAGAGDVVITIESSSIDARAELVDEHQELEHVAPPATCDLRACDCSSSHVALCCDGPCPRGFEGMTCYCGDCRFPTTYDAGRCN